MTKSTISKKLYKEQRINTEALVRMCVITSTTTPSSALKTTITRLLIRRKNIRIVAHEEIHNTTDIGIKRNKNQGTRKQGKVDKHLHNGERRKHKDTLKSTFSRMISR